MIRVGHGYDVHQLVIGRRLMIGGVDVPFERGLQGHSDADVLLHAISDALLGAAAMGDIGKYFPDTDQRYKGINSRQLLQHIVGLLKEKQYSIVNIDATVIAEAPKLAPYTAQMCTNIAHDCGIDVDAVNVKATTTEKLGYIGRGEGIASDAVCLIQRL